MGYLIKIIVYIGLACLPFAITKRVRQSGLPSGKLRKRIGTGQIVFLGVLFGWYSTICSKLPYSLDRERYARRFAENWNDPWTAGLNTVADILHWFTSDPEALFFTVTLLCVILTLVAYRVSDVGSKESLLFWTFGMSIVNSFYLLKQAPAIALGALSIALFLKRKYISSTVFLILAVLFHESALVLLPLYVAMMLAGKQWRRWIIYPLIAGCVLFFASASKIAIQFFEMIYPDLSEQVSGYLDASGGIYSAENLITALKGFPYYLIAAYGFMNRRSLKNEIRHYDQYLILSVSASGLYLLSGSMYWMWRFAAYCFLPMYLFASELYQKATNRRVAQLFFWGVLGSLAFFTLRYLYQIYFNYGGF